MLSVWQHGLAAIHLAAWFGSLDILKLLVQAGAEQKVENEVKAATFFTHRGKKKVKIKDCVYTFS